MYNELECTQETLAATARMLQALNARFDATSVARMLSDFEKQTVLMANTQELMDDTLDNSFEVEGEQDATNDAVLAVLQEVGLDVQSRLNTTSSEKKTEIGLVNTDASDLDARLQRLRMTQSSPADTGSSNQPKS